MRYNDSDDIMLEWDLEKRQRSLMTTSTLIVELKATKIKLGHAKNLHEWKSVKNDDEAC
jgi:hypothetical protein